MAKEQLPKVALVWQGDQESRDHVNLDEHRLGKTAAGLRATGLEPVAVVFNEEAVDEVRDRLLGVDAVLVWVNPIEQGRDRSVLDRLLTEVAATGILVSAHPNIIQKIGTKEVLYQTRHMSWGSDVHVYRTLDQLKDELPARVASHPRVLKQFRGHSGHGVWRVAYAGQSGRVLARHAARGSVEREISLEELFEVSAPFFDVEGGRVVEQPYQERISEGTIRCYMVRDRLEGFGHQEINALYPSNGSEVPPEPGPRLYSPATEERFQEVKRRMEGDWLPNLMAALDIRFDELPMLWDADLMLGPKSAEGDDTYVLCEINVSSVYPYPESAIAPLAAAVRDGARKSSLDPTRRRLRLDGG